jgi:hypothetical protein
METCGIALCYARRFCYESLCLLPVGFTARVRRISPVSQHISVGRSDCATFWTRGIKPFFIRLPPDAISLQLCALKVVGV